MALDQLEKFFDSSYGAYCYTYYIDPKTANIYLEYEIEMGTKYLSCYYLKLDRETWYLESSDQVMTDTGLSQAGGSSRVADRDKKAAIEFMIKEILEQPRENAEAKVNLNKLEERLRRVLAQYQHKI